MRPSVLLDTSAFQALATCRLEAASQSTSLYVSPFCFWELLTHLEDDDRFRRVKGNLMKFRHVEVLDDPHGEVYRLVFRSSDNIHLRVRDGDLIDAALAALDDSTSTKEFYERFIRDECGQIHQIAGCVSAVRGWLQIEENRFQTFLRRIVAAVRAGEVRLTQASDYNQGIRDLTHGWWLQVCDRTNQAIAVYEQFAQKTYMHHSYLLHRARDYANRDADRIDPNDFEDARLCLHLGLNHFTAVVTNDAGLQRCLKASLEALKAMAGAAPHALVQVWDTADFGGD